MRQSQKICNPLGQKAPSSNPRSRKSAPGSIGKLQSAGCLTHAWVLLVLYFTLALTPLLPLSAQEPDLKDLKSLSLEDLLSIKVPTVVGASKYEQKVTEAPSSISLITAEDIHRFGYRTLSDALKSARGIYVSYDRLYGYIGVRGFNRPGDFGGRILILIDGHRLNEPIFDSAFNGTDFLVDVDLIERIEIVRGPGSTLYGNNAFFGVINVVTRRGKDLDGVEISGSAASYDSFQGRWSYGNRFKNGLDLLFSGTLYDSQGKARIYEPAFNSPASNSGIAEKMDSDQFHSFFASTRYHGLSLEAGYISRDKRTPFAPYETLFNDPRQHPVDTRGFVSAGLTLDLANDWELTSRLYYDYYTLSVDYPSETVSGTVLNKERDIAQWVGLETQLSRQFGEQHRVTAGMEGRYDFSLSVLSYDVDPYNLLSNFRDETKRFGIFAQDEYSILKNLKLDAGVRYDYYDSFGGTVNPRAGLIWSAAPKTIFKLLYGQAYRAPNVWEAQFQNFDQKPNPNLDPEQIRTYELVYEQYLTTSTRMSWSGFFHQTSALIGQTQDPLDGKQVFVNLDKATTLGTELEADYQGANGFNARSSYTLQRTKDSNTGADLSNSPHHLAKLNLSQPLWQEKLVAAIEFQFSSKAGTTPGRVLPYASSFWISNFTLSSRNLVKGLNLSLSVYNLFDEHYAYPASEEYVPDVIRQDGRTFRVKATYHF